VKGEEILYPSYSSYASAVASSSSAGVVVVAKTVRN